MKLLAWLRSLASAVFDRARVAMRVDPIEALRYE